MSINLGILCQNLIDSIDEFSDDRYNEKRYVVFKTTLKSKRNFIEKGDK